MLRIQVLGSGIIPRGYGLAPRKEFFWADKLLIQTILTDSRLSINMQHPADGRLVKVTRQNLEKLWNSYSDKYNTTSTENTIKTEVINKPETLIDKNNKKVPKEPLKIEVKESPSQIIEKSDIGTDKQFEAAVNKAIENASKTINNVKPEAKKEEVKVAATSTNNMNNNQNKNNQTNNNTNQKKDEVKKDEKKTETILHPINNPENK